MTKDSKRRMELSEEDFVQSSQEQPAAAHQQQHKFSRLEVKERQHNGINTMMATAAAAASVTDHKNHQHHHAHQNHHQNHHKDHLLVPYIRDSSNFIMDLMEHPDEVFPKNTSTVHLPPTTSSGSQYVVRDALTAELHHFPGSIFQFVHKDAHDHDQHHHMNIDEVVEEQQQQQRQLVQSTRSNAQSVQTEVSPPPLTLHSAAVVVPDDEAFSHKHHHAPDDFLSMNNDFLGSTSSSGSKAFCGSDDATLAVQPSAVQPFPPLSSLLAEPSVSINHTSVLDDVNNDVMFAAAAAAARSNIARKVLPHKKRISHKLKVAQIDADAAELALHSSVVDAIIEPVKLPPVNDDDDGHLRLPMPLSPHVVVTNTLQFSCELCGHATSSQIEFFAHLKQHYEPTTSDRILAAMKTSLDDLGPEKDSLCAMGKKVNETNHDVVVHQVFNDVHLNFSDFHTVDEVESVRDVITHHHQHRQHHQTNPHDDMKILNSNSIDKCINYVHQVESTPLKDIAVDEVEFSDTEDMLEGIRNVVDKVSIEDTCDDIDLMVTPNGLRAAPWFANDSFSAMGATSLSQIQPESLKIEDPNTLLAYTNTDSIEKSAKQEIHDTNCTPAPPFFPKMEEENNCHDNTSGTTPTSFKIENDTDYDGSIDCDKKVTRVIRQRNKAYKKQLKEEEHEQNHEEVVEEDLHPQDFLATVAEDIDENDEDYTPREDTPMMTSQTKQKHFICTKCGREFNSGNALKYHYRTHSGFRPHQCEVCGRSFFAHGALKAHMRTHTGDKPFECMHCQRKFGQWGDLKYHTVSIHSDEKSHQCEFCGKAFSRKYSLVLHRRIHTSERNYSCDYCSKTFRASSYLQNHRKIHTGEKPHECTVCGKKFRVSGDLRRHMQIHQRTDLKNVIKTEEVDYIEEAISAEEKKTD